MEGEPGTLRVQIVRGRRLAIRDFKSSDPYVVVRLGNQTQKTKVINSCLNPVWNEELVFAMPEAARVLQLEVFDRDRFKHDDKMGRGDVDLQGLVSGIRLSRALRLSKGETQLRKVAPNGENSLMAESFVVFVDGEIVQNLRLKLRDVESGEIELSLRWSPNPVYAPAMATSV
ncbi:calcium-dependent lipid-binding (CaLB domain) family protein isoform X1 [Wolffia australiana]